MKSLVVSAVAALVGHGLLFAFQPPWQQPRPPSPPSRSVTVTLMPMVPKVARPVPRPLPSVLPTVVAPLRPLALKPAPPKPKPAIVPEPQPQPMPTPAPTASLAPAPDTDPRSSVDTKAKPDLADAPLPGAEGASLEDSSIKTWGQNQMTVTAPSPIFSPKPRYPGLARRRQYQGRVVVEALVNVQGAVVSVETVQSSGYDILDRAAEQGVVQWRFQPALKNGMAVEQKVKIPVVFRLN